MTARPFAIGERRVGPGAPTFVIAEAGVNHNGDLRLALELVDVAADAGADAIKFQTFQTDALVSRGAPTATYQKQNADATDQRAMLAALELTLEQFAAIRDRCAKRSLIFFSTPFGEASADALESLGVALYKIPSGEITNLGLLRHVAAKGRPVILSTGMSTLDEVAIAVDAIGAAGAPPLAILHCLSSYPAPAAETNLRAMDTLRERFGDPVGLSDHTLGIEVALAAVARGATIIEKHFTLDKTLRGPDHLASLEPDELTALVRGIRTVEAALGDGEKRPMPSELETRQVARKSLVAARAIRAGERLTADLVAVKRPGTGIPPGELSRVLGRKVLRDLAPDEVIDWAAVEAG